MPRIDLEVSCEVTPEEEKDLLTSLSAIITQDTGKPGKYVMASLGRKAIRMSGTDEPAAFADVRGIGGLDGEVNARITRDLCDLLQKTFGIVPERVYVTFSNITAPHWGWNSQTFG